MFSKYTIFLMSAFSIITQTNSMQLTNQKKVTSHRNKINQTQKDKNRILLNQIQKTIQQNNASLKKNNRLLSIL